MPELYNVRLNEGGLDMDRLRRHDDEEDTNQFGPNTLLQDRDEPDVAYFKCGWCGFAHPEERTVRTHITREDEGKHKNKNAFLDDVFVQACDDDGEVIGDMESPKTMSLSEGITDEYLPRAVNTDTKTAKILKQAIETPQMSEREIAEEVYGEDPTQSNISYVYSILNQYLSQEAVEEGNVASDTGSGDQPLYTTTRRGMTADPDADMATDTLGQRGGKSYEDLKPKQQVLINEHVRNEVDDLDRPMTVIEDLAGVSTGYGSRVVDKYPEIVDTREEQYENGEIELPDPEDILGEAPTHEKSYEDLSPLQQRVIDNWVQNPDQKKRDLEHKANASPGYSARLFRKYGDIRDRRREAYEQGVLQDKHLNIPDREEFIEDTSVPQADQVEIPKSEQPRGTPLEDVQQGDAGSRATAPTPLDETEVATSEDIEAVRNEVESLQDSVAAQLATTTERIGDLEQRAQQLETSLDNVESPQPTRDALPDDIEAMESRIETLENTLDEVVAVTEQRSGSVESPVADGVQTAEEENGTTDAQISPVTPEDIEHDGVSEVRLNSEQVTRVVKALSAQLPDEENDIIQKVVTQA